MDMAKLAKEHASQLLHEVFWGDQLCQCGSSFLTDTAGSPRIDMSLYSVAVKA